MFARIGTIVWKEILQLARDRMLTAFLFLLPILQLYLLSQATGGSVSDLGVAVLDMDRSAVSRRMINDLDTQEELRVLYFVADEDELQDLLDRGQVDVGIIFPRGLAKALVNPVRTAQVAILVDASNSVVGSSALGAASSALTRYGRELLAERGLSSASGIDLRVVTYYNPTYNLRYFSIPAQVGFITYQITLSVASLGLARERELGTLEQLIVTPLGRLELVIGKAIPPLLVGASNFVLMMVVATHFLGIPFRGSFALLLGLTLLFVAAEIGFGMLISAAARTQQQAILFVFILALVDLSLSGYMVPVENLPTVLQAVSQVVPMHHYLVIIRAVVLKGATLSILWPHALALVGLGAVIMAISASGVSRRLD
ncbi:MAG: ABC transporter permease [Anaerolineae bacterium]|nr:ABC transporter permease [Anaerolineae bacterium]